MRLPEAGVRAGPVVMLLVLVLAVLSFRTTLGYPIIGSDTYTLIDTSRVDSLRDIGRIFNQRLMAGSEFTGTFYRPLSSLSFAVDYATWGLEPFGYHLSNVLAHAMVAVLFLMLINRLTGRFGASTALAAVIFATHPLVAETVPAISRRQDVLGALFAVLSLLLFMRSRDGERRRAIALGASLISFVAGLLCKESVVVVPALVFFGALMFSPGSNRCDWRQAALCSVPHVAATAIVALWRMHVLGGLGAYKIGTKSLAHGFLYVGALADIPAALLAPTLSPPGIAEMGMWPSAWMGGGLVGALGLMLYRWRAFVLHPRMISPVRVVHWILAAVFVVVTVCAAVTMACSGLVDRLVRHAFYDGSPAVIANLIDRGAGEPLEHYLARATQVRSGILVFLFVGMVGSAGGLLIIHGRHCIAGFLRRSRPARVGWFMALWLACSLPALLFSLSPEPGFLRRSMYVSVIPFSGLLGLASTYLVRTAWEQGRLWADNQRLNDRHNYAVIAGALVCVGLMTWLLATSNLVRSRTGWEGAAATTVQLFEELGRLAQDLPTGATLHLRGAERRHPFARSHFDDHRIVKSATYLSRMDVQSWLNLHFPGKGLKVEIDRVSWPPPPGRSMSLELRRFLGGSVTVTVHTDRPPVAS